VSSQNVASADYLFSYTLDQYRVFCMLEPLLQQPSKLFDQILFQLTPSSQKDLVLKYYEIDEVVVRELAGKKLNKGTRRDLDEVSIRTHKPLKLCQRQFDNCRRIYKVVEDAPKNIVDLICEKFFLPSDLARQYAAIIFLSSNRFECNKRKLSHLRLHNFIECSIYLTDSWTIGNFGAEFDPEFLHNLRNLKNLSNDINKIFRMFLSLLDNETEEIRNRLTCNESTVKIMMKNTISIASNLYKPKNMKYFFVDSIEKICDLAKTLGWRVDHLQKFFDLFQNSIKNCRNDLMATWERYFKTFTLCSLQLYRF